MARKPSTELASFFKPFKKDAQKIGLHLRELVLNLFPDANELIYDHYNALALGYSLSDKQRDLFCHVAVYLEYANIGFDHGADLDDPKQLLKGNGKRIRHISVKQLDQLDEKYVQGLLRQAVKIAHSKLGKDSVIIKGQSIVKSVAKHRTRPGQ